jgi:hypothetical protein
LKIMEACARRSEPQLLLEAPPDALLLALDHRVVVRVALRHSLSRLGEPRGVEL